MVYIDLPNNGYSHCIASSIPELHEFAKLIGVGKHFYHNPRNKKKPH